MSELNLLIECINTEGEAENGGVKYIYMDSDTIYRFENNRMKKISKSLINKARKQLSAQNAIHQVNGSTNDKSTKRKSASKSQSKTTRTSNRDESVDEYYNDGENEVDVTESIDEDDRDNVDSSDVDKKMESDEKPRVKKTKSLKSKISTPLATPLTTAPYSPNINLDEYYNNKNKMEYMNLEIARLNSKVDKLKHYKAIVNKLTGNEFDLDTSNSVNSQYSTQSQFISQPQSKVRNDSLFLY